MKIEIYNILFLIILISVGCTSDSIEYEKALKEESGMMPDQVANNVEVVFFDSVLTKATLKASRAEISNEKNTTELIGDVEVEFFSEKSGKRLSILYADKAIIYDVTKDMEAIGNVKVLSDSANITLETTKLKWNNEKMIVYTEEFITITTPNEIINGYGFESDLSLSHYKIYKVSGIKQ